MRKKLLSDIFALVAEAGNFPDFANEDQTATYFGTLAPGLVHVAYDAIGSDKAALMEAELADLDSIDWQAVADEHQGIKALPESRLTDLLTWLTTNGPALVQFVMTIIGMFQKTPKPANVV